MVIRQFLAFVLLGACATSQLRLPADGGERAFVRYIERELGRRTGQKYSFDEGLRYARMISPGAARAQRDYDLSDAEFLAIHQYTSIHFRDVNVALWHREGVGQHRPYIEMLETALAKLPDHEGLVYRGIRLDGDQLKVYRVGAVVEFPGFTSTSYAPNIYMERTGYSVMRIHSKHGKNIEAFSSLPSEKEVLFTRGTRFRVVSVRDDYGRAEVELEELR